MCGGWRIAETTLNGVKNRIILYCVKVAQGPECVSNPKCVLSRVEPRCDGRNTTIAGALYRPQQIAYDIECVVSQLCFSGTRRL